MVEPTNVKPRRLRSLLIASESSVRAGISWWDCLEFLIGAPPTKRQNGVDDAPLEVGHHLQLRTGDDPALTAHVDLQLLEAALMNLLSNGFKYTRARGSVTLNGLLLESTPRPRR